MSVFLHSELSENVVKANMERNDKEKRKKKKETNRNASQDGQSGLVRNRVKLSALTDSAEIDNRHIVYMC